MRPSLSQNRIKVLLAPSSQPGNPRCEALYFLKEHKKQRWKVVTMLYEEQNTFRRTPGLLTWLFWVVLTAFGGMVGTFLLSFISNANPSLNGLLIWCYLASPLFFVALGQWVLLRRFVAQSGWWLLTGVLGSSLCTPIFSSTASLPY